MKRWPLAFLLVLAFSAHAETYWDGNAAVQTGDAEFASSLVALSNAFARDTEIVVQDLATGKTTTARVVGRLDGQLDILVLLSPAAALPLGLEQGEIASVRVTVEPSTPGVSASILAEGTEPGADPDRLLSTAAVATEAVTTSEPAEVAEAPVAEAPAEEAPVEAAAPTQETVASAEESDLVAGLADRSPQKQLFLPPREDEKFAYQQPVEPPAEPPAETVEVAEQPSETAVATTEVAATSAPEIVSVVGPAAPAASTEPVTLVEAQPPAEVLPELVETLAAAAPEPETEPARPLAVPEAVAAGETAAAAEKPVPAETPAPTEKPVAAEKPSAAQKPAPVVTVLDLPGTGTFTWYLQLAAYSTESLAKETAARLTPTYPVLVLAPPAGSKPLYRVFVGPLNRAESGTLLAYFRHKGFPDAFVRTARN